MNTISKIIHQVFDIEINTLTDVKMSLNKSVVDAIQLLHACSGKIVISGIGKSGKIAEKISSTLTSTGSFSIFLHPSEAAHGDLGVIKKEDVVILISKSGESEEIIQIIPVIHKIGAKILSIVSNDNSTIAKYSDICIFLPIKEEACDLKLAPTSSTTATLVMGDAIAMALRHLKKFREEDFALFHPGGQLGKRLLINVADVMHKDNNLPYIYFNESTEDLIYKISKFGLGVIAVVNKKMELLGIITDGDLRRSLKGKQNIFDLKISAFMTKNPLTIDKDKSAFDALKFMETGRTLNHLPVVKGKKFIGMLSLHDLIKLGI